LLDQEHRASIDLLGQVEVALGRARQADAALAGLIRQLVRHVEHDIERHFTFEETALFPRLAAAGDGDMVALLTEEHEAMRAVALELLPLARAAAAGAIDDSDWRAFKRCALEMVERQVAHIQKETMALLPLLDDLLDEDDDRDLAMAYAAL